MITAQQPYQDVLKNLEQNQNLPIRIERTILEQKILEIDKLYSQFCGSKILSIQNKTEIQDKINHIDSVYIQIKQHNHRCEEKKKRSQKQIKHHDNELDFKEQTNLRLSSSEKENTKILPQVEEEVFMNISSNQSVDLNRGRGILKVDKKFVTFSQEKEEKESHSLGRTTSTQIVKITPKNHLNQSYFSNLKSQMHQTEGTYDSAIDQTSCRKLKKQLVEEQSQEEKERTLQISQTHLSPLKKSFLDETIQSSLRKNTKVVPESSNNKDSKKNFKQNRQLQSQSSEKYKKTSKGSLTTVQSKSSTNSRVNSLEKKQSNKSTEITNLIRVQEHKPISNGKIIIKNEKKQLDNTNDSDTKEVLKSNYYAHKWLNKQFDRERKQTDIDFINSLYERANSAQALLK